MAAAPSAGQPLDQPGLLPGADPAAGHLERLLRRSARRAHLGGAEHRAGTAADPRPQRAARSCPRARLAVLRGEPLLHPGRAGGLRPGPGAVWLGRGDPQPGAVLQRADVYALEVPAGSQAGWGELRQAIALARCTCAGAPGRRDGGQEYADRPTGWRGAAVGWTALYRATNAPLGAPCR